MKKIYIYGLYTDEEDIRYVGKSIDPERRLKLHYSQRNKGKTHKNSWIRKCVREDVKINIKIIEEVFENNWVEREKYWISFYKKNLTNTSPGGEGGHGKKYSIDYDTCKEIIKNLNIKSITQWKTFSSSNSFPADIPKSPSEYFRENWISWGDFLSTNRKQDNLIIKDYKNYYEAKKWINENLNVKNVLHWISIKEQLPNFIPKRPDRFYKKRGWVSWGDFLGNNRIAYRNRKIVKYEEAKNIVNNLNINTIKEYKILQKKIKCDLPVHPHLTYKNKGFTSYADFFRH